MHVDRWPSWLWRQVKVILTTISWSRKWRGFGRFISSSASQESLLTSFLESHSVQQNPVPFFNRLTSVFFSFVRACTLEFPTVPDDIIDERGDDKSTGFTFILLVPSSQ